MMTNNINYIKAYTEVNCLLEYLPQSYIEKLPKKLIELIKKQSDENFNIDIDTNKSLSEQDFSKKTKDLIAVIKYNYWSTDEERRQLINLFYENENKYQEELLEKYNPNDIFKKREQKVEVNNPIDSNTQIALYKENIFTKFLNKLKNLFRKK